jgi:hypothetical protein
MGQAMGGSARSGLPKAIAVNSATAAKETNKPAVRNKARIGAETAQKMQHVEAVQDRPTTIANISSNYANQFTDLVGRAAASDAPSIPGTGWYFDHRRGAEAALPPGHELASRQVAAMSAKLSASKTPEDERESMAGIHDLTTAHANATVNGMRVASMSSEEVASHASNEAAWNAHLSPQGQRKGTKRPSSPRPVTSGPDVSDALRRAGRAHEPNVAQATSIARGQTDPHEAFSDTTPKTAAYGEMIAQSNPGSLAETDYRNISAHILDTARGAQHPSQGMMLFSKTTPDSELPHVLRQDVPTAIDTWMFAAGSGQPASAPNVHPQTGEPAGGRGIRVSKRMTDKNMPLDATTKKKSDMGLTGTDASVTPGAAASAQHMEAVTRASKKLGPVTFNQHGQDIAVPASLIQETVWTDHRRQAGADPVHAAVVRGQEASEKEAAGKAKAAAKAQGKLF